MISHNTTGSLYYQLSEGTPMMVTQSIIMQSSNIIHFYQCQENATFFVGKITPLYPVKHMNHRKLLVNIF